MPKRFTLADEFTDTALEQALLAAIAARPERYWELLDLLPPEAFTETRQAFEKLAAAIEQEGPLPAAEKKAWVGSDIKELREKLGMTQKQLAAYLEITQGQLANIEAGRRRLTPHQKQKLLQLEKATVFHG